MAKKSTKKETLEAKVERELEAMENSNDKMESTKINTSVEAMIDSINSVDVELKSDSEERIQEMVEEFSNALEPIRNISSEISSLTNTGNFNEKVSNANPHELESIIQKEIDNTKELIKKVEEIKRKNTTTSVTNWWNGMGYDF